jgi:DNA replication protein DnaC
VRKLKIYTDPNFICDELDICPRSANLNLFYQVISTRHARKRSTVITTNTILRLGNISTTRPSHAIADRLVENSEVFLMGGPTWRNPKNGQVASQ